MNPLFFLLLLLGARGASSDGSSDEADTTSVVFTSTLPDTEEEDPVTEGDPVAEADPDPVVEPEPQPEPEPEPEPQPEDNTDDVPPPAPTPEVVDETPEPPEQSGDGGAGGQTDPVVIDGTVEVMAGRVATLAPSGDDITDLRIIQSTDHGTVTVNPDGTFALVMTKSDFTGSQSFTYEAQHSDGTTSLHEINLDVVPGLQDGGWGTGEKHYMLETDADDRVVVETGDNHTKVYVSGSEDAWTLEKIAIAEGMSVSAINGSWLASHGGYGQSEDMALAEDAGTLMWHAVTPAYSETSNWLLFERGYQYGDFAYNENDDMQRLLKEDANGEGELHPIYIGAWGEGDKPEITNRFMQFQESSDNVVIQDVHFTGQIFWLGGANILFDNIDVTENKMSIQGTEGVTVRNSDIYDVYREASLDGGDWDQHLDRISGFYANYIDGFLMENMYIDHNGWADGYDPEGDASGGQPPSMYSQNLYLSFDITDLTLRDTITMRAASFGAQVRGGGFIEDVVFLDNNAAFITTGGDTGDGEAVGQYSLLSSTLLTSAGYREALQIGAKSSGLIDQGELTSFVDNIVAHLADPNDPSELDYKLFAGPGIATTDPYYDDTIVWNWHASEPNWAGVVTEQNVDGLDTNVLDATTIQLFTAQLLGKPDATIADLAGYIRSQSDGVFDDLVDADLIIQFFQEGFGLAVDERLVATELRFVPNDLGEGVRWDNRLNWDTDDLPGTVAGDSVDLGGNHVVYGTNTTIDELALSDGALNVYGGRLDATGGITDGGHLNVEGAGQAWIGGHSGDDTLDVDVSGGRFANTGTMGNTDLDVTGGQALLATGGAEYDVASGRTLAIFDAAAKVGFDGDDGGMAILDMEEGAELTLGSSDGEMASIEELRSGAFGDASNVQSGIDLGGATLKLDLSGLSATQAGSFTLMDADEIVGLVDAATLEIGGLGGRDANIVIDYVTDSVTLELTEGGSGAIDISTVGDERQSDHDALWTALTADQGLAENQPLPEEEDLLLDVA